MLLSEAVNKRNARKVRRAVTVGKTGKSGRVMVDNRVKKRSGLMALFGGGGGDGDGGDGVGNVHKHTYMRMNAPNQFSRESQEEALRQ